MSEEILEFNYKKPQRSLWDDVIRCPHCGESGLKNVHFNILECGQEFTLENREVTWHGGCQAYQFADINEAFRAFVNLNIT